MRAPRILLFGLTLLAPAPLRAGIDHFTPFGLGGGYIDQVVATPGNLYAGGGVALYKSTDGGITWNWSALGLPWVDTLAASPHRPEVLYALSFGRVFRSTDGAATWADVSGPLFDFQTRLLAVGSGNPAWVYVAYEGKLYRSSDGGTSWSFVYQASDRITALVADPQHPRLLYVTVKNLGLLASRDGGLSWKRLLARKYLHRLALAPSRPSRIYAASGTTLWTSPDAGETWEPRSVAPRGSEVLVVDPVAPSTVYAGGSQGLVMSRDGGKRWSRADRFNYLIVAQPSSAESTEDRQGLGVDPDGDGRAQLTGWIEGATLQALAIDPLHPNRLHVGTRRFGVYTSRNRGRSWLETYQSGLTVNLVWEMRFAPWSADFACMVTENWLGPVACTDDGGAHWHSFLPPSGAERFHAVALDPTDPRALYFLQRTPEGSRLLRTRYPTWAWEDLGEAPGGPLTLTGGALFAGAGPGLARSLDHGATWSWSLGPDVETPGCSAPCGRPFISTRELIVDPADPAVLYAVGYWTEGITQVPAVFRSADGGDSWRLILDHSNVLTVTRTSAVYAVKSGQVQASTDQGATWSAVVPFPAGETAFDLAADPFESATLYAGTERGVLRSKDGGITWSVLDEAFARRGGVRSSVRRIEPHPTIPGRIYIQPFPGGTFEIQLTH